MSKCFVTGDTHGDIDIHKTSNKRWPESKLLTKDDYLIITGDSGIVWDGDRSDRYIQKYWLEKPYTVLFVDGNHENHDLLDSLPVEVWNGGKIHRIAPGIIHLMRGQVFTIDGSSIFTFGGAKSTDKQYRKEGKSWWAREMPSKDEYEEGLKNLAAHDFKVDYVITHDCDSSLLPVLGGDYVSNELTDYFKSLLFDYHLDFSKWYFGHHHVDEEFSRGQFVAVYNNIYHIGDSCRGG